MPGVLLKISAPAETLVRETTDFVFFGEPTDQLHPELEKTACYPDGVVMPVAELPPVYRHVIVATALVRSMRLLAIDSYGSYDIKGMHASRVADPLAYLDLYKTGKKVNRLAKRGLIIGEEDQEHELIVPLAAAGAFQLSYDNLMSTNPDLYKEVLKRLRYAEPMLAEGETKAQRDEQRRYLLSQKAQRWRYARPLAVAAASGCMLVNAYHASQDAKSNNPAVIAELNTERASASDARAEQIDSEINRLNAQMDGDMALWGVITGGALLRAGVNYLDRPRIKSVK